MIRIALVGDIGSGKSYFSKLFGYPVFNADSVVAQIYKKNKTCYNQIKKIFPNNFSTFPLKKEELIKCILSNQNNLKKITRIVHPLVSKQMKFFIKKNKNKKFVILDIPLFLENNLNLKNDLIIFIQSTKSKINKSLIKRKNYNKRLIHAFKKIQWSLPMKKKKSDFIIKNTFERRKALRDVQDLMKKII